MNPTHFLTLLKLRAKLTFNQVKKGGKVNTIFAALFYSIGAISVISSFFIASIGGAVWFRDISPFTLLVIWNVTAAAFLFMWVIGLIGELQQTELISIDKLLHLPVSLKGAYFLNYTSTFYNMTFLMMAPTMLGMAVGLVFAKGLHMSVAIPLVIAFLFLVTSLTFQLRGWLATLMENKRKKGTLTALMILAIVALTQIPNMASYVIRDMQDNQDEIAQEQAEEQREIGIAILEARYEAGELPVELNGWDLEELDYGISQDLAERKRAQREKKFALVTKTLKTTDTFFPPGWLPLGIIDAHDGKWLGGVLGFLGMTLIGSISMMFSYRSSMRKYTGFVKTKRRKKIATASKAPKLEFMFKRLPFCSDAVSSVAVATLRGLMRAPETKLMLVLPMLGAFGLAFVIYKGGSNEIPDFFWPLFSIGAIALTMFTVVSTVFNQFGMDRDGFRAFVLSPLERRDILFGKNLAFIPLGMGIALVLTILIQFAFPVDITSFFAAMLQIPCNFLIYCLVGNAVSIYFPMGIKRGTMQPANPRFLPMLIMIIATFVLPSFLLAPTSLAIGIPMLLAYYFEWSVGPIYLLLTMVQMALTSALYFYILNFQGYWLWSREPKILDIVANIPE